MRKVDDGEKEEKKKKRKKIISFLSVGHKKRNFAPYVPLFFLPVLQSLKSPIFEERINQILIQHPNFVLALEPKVLKLEG